MMKHGERMSSLIILIATLYGSMVIGMVLMQRHMMYKPVAGNIVPEDFGLSGFSDITITDHETSLQLWYKEAVGDLPTIIYFHGNAGHLGDRAGLFSALAGKGLGIAAVSYRGYGKSKGSPHEHGIYSDARAAVKWVRSRGIPLTNIAFYGESLGTGVAVKMATEFQPKALFLQAPYTSVVNRAAEIYWYVPVKYLMRDRFDSLTRIKQVTSPLMIFHGRLDDVIPAHHAERLLAEANEPKNAMFFDHVMHADFDDEVIAEQVLSALANTDVSR